MENEGQWFQRCSNSEIVDMFYIFLDFKKNLTCLGVALKRRRSKIAAIVIIGLQCSLMYAAEQNKIVLDSDDEYMNYVSIDLNYDENLYNYSQANEQDVDGLTRLHRAVRDNVIEKIENLIAEPVDLNVQDDGGWTPLHRAVMSNQIDIAQMLLVAGADKNIKNKASWTPLYIAAWDDNVDMVKILIDAKVNLNVKNYHGLTAYGIAHKRNHEKIMQMLIDAGADTTIKPLKNKLTKKTGKKAKSKAIPTQKKSIASNDDCNCKDIFGCSIS